MRTTIDLPPVVLAKAKRLAVERGSTLSAVVTDALSAHLQNAKRENEDKRFELVVRGTKGAHFPSPAEIAEIEAKEDATALFSPAKVGGRAAR